MIMKKCIILLFGAAMLLTIGGCQKDPKIDIVQALDMNISIEGDVLQESTPNFLTLTVENTSEDKVILSESSFMLEFTSYSGSIKKTFYIDPSEDVFSTQVLPQARLEIKGNSVLSRKIDLGKIMVCSPVGNEITLPIDDYTVNLIINVNPDPKMTKNNQIIRSNYADIQVRG